MQDGTELLKQFGLCKRIFFRYNLSSFRVSIEFDFSVLRMLIFAIKELKLTL